jgi:2-methylisocitrate lyase-like PEP mutase family enzyme
VAATAIQLVEAGAQAVNIEDGGQAPETLAAKIAAIRAAVGDALFINARCDLWLAGVGAPAGRVDEAVRRAVIYQAAGADGLFAPGLVDPEGIATLVGGTALPVNLLAFPGLPKAETLERLGVRRLSAGSGLASAAYGRAATLAREFLSTGVSEPMNEGALGWGEMNALMPR